MDKTWSGEVNGKNETTTTVDGGKEKCMGMGDNGGKQRWENLLLFALSRFCSLRIFFWGGEEGMEEQMVGGKSNGGINV